MADAEVKDKDPRTTAAEDAGKLAELLVAAAKRRTDAAMTPGEVSAALEDTKKAQEAVDRAKESGKAAETAIKNEDLAEKSRLAQAEATQKVAEEAAKSQEEATKKEAETPAPTEPAK